MWVAAKDSVDGALKFIAQSSVNALGDLSMQGIISAGGKVVMKADDSAGGDLSGTYPSTLTVTKIQGYAVQAHAPVNGETLIWVAGNNRYEPGVSAGTGIPDPATKVANDILQYTGAAWDAVGAAVGDPVTGPLYTGALTLVGAVNQLWNTDGGGNIGAAATTRPDKVYAKTSIWQGANQVLDTSMNLAGDVSGGYGTNTVDKIKNVAVLAGVPSDRQMFTYDSTGVRWEAQWPGMTNFSENRTFTILPAGSTPAQINTALADYDVVYLEPGTYTMGATPIAIPSGKALIGLGDSSWGGTGAPQIDGTAGNTGANFITMNNGYLSNVTCAANAAQAVDIIAGNVGNYANYVDRVNVATVAANNLCAAFVGGFVRIDRFRVDNVNGVYFNKSAINLYGPSVFSNFVINNAPTYGFTLLDGFIKIDNGYVNGNAKATDYGIYYNNATGYANHWISNIRFYQCAIGIYYSYTTNRPWRVFITNCDTDSCTDGISLNGPAQASVTNCQAIGNTVSGFYFTDMYYSTITGCAATACAYGFRINGCYRTAFGTLSAAGCNITAGIGYGSFYFANCNSSTFTNLASFQANNTNNAGFYISICSSCQFSGLTDYESTYGVYVASTSDNCTISDVETYNTGSFGFFTDTNQRYRCSFSNISAFSSGGGPGIQIQYCDLSVFSGLRTDSATNQGIYINNCDNCSGGNWSSMNSAGTGIIIVNCTYCAFSSFSIYWTGGVGLWLNGCTGVAITGGAVYQASTTGVYVVSCSYCRVSDVTSNTNRTNGASSHGFWLDTGNIGNALVGCMSYLNRRHGFCTTINTNQRTLVASCHSLQNSQEAAGTYRNIELPACGAGTSLFSGSLSVLTGAGIWNVHGDWNRLANFEV